MTSQATVIFNAEENLVTKDLLFKMTKYTLLNVNRYKSKQLLNQDKKHAPRLQHCITFWTFSSL